MMRVKLIAMGAFLFLAATTLAGPRILTYQGSVLNSAGDPVPDGAYDMRFSIFDAEVGGVPIWTEDDLGVQVTNGLFSTLLGDGRAFDDMFSAYPSLWLEVAVDLNESGLFDADEVYTPRVRLAASAWAIEADRLEGLAAADFQRRVTGSAPPGEYIRAINADGTVLTAAQAPWAELIGVPAGFADGIDNVDDTVSWGEISGIAGAGSNQVAIGNHDHNGTHWKLSGNAATTSGTDFLGTLDPVPVDLRTSGARALRLEPAAGAPNLIGGHGSNYAVSGVEGATIGGGGVWDAGSGLILPNQVGEDYATIGGGQGNLSLGLSATIGGGRGNRADAAVSTIAGGQLNYAGGPYSTVGGGTQNSATTQGATVGGGRFNGAIARFATVGGGEQNAAGDTWATVGGGQRNVAAALQTTIGGGYLNNADAAYATIGGGQRNQATSVTTTIGGGYLNFAQAAYAVVSGGGSNRADGYASTVGGGRSNAATRNYASISGGLLNEASSDYSAVGGGRSNMATSYSATVGGGRDNRALGWSSTIAGGWENSAENTYASVGGGYRNLASGLRATIGGGYQHEASGNGSTVGGGYRNGATGVFATVGGGQFNFATTRSATVAGGQGNYASGGFATIGGGQANSATSESATVPGGYLNVAEAPFSFAAGRRARASHAGSFVWADSRNDTDFASQRDYQFRVRAYGGARFDDDVGNWVELMWDQLIDTSSGAYLTYGGTWTNGSDRNAKENFEPVDGQEVLARVAQLPITTWNYKAEDPSSRHMGPMAQDVYAAFGLGDSDKSISTIDADGVALAAIQGLYQLAQEQKARIAFLQNRIASLQKDVAQLEAGEAAHESQNAEIQERLAALERLLAAPTESHLHQGDLQQIRLNIPAGSGTGDDSFGWMLRPGTCPL